MHRKIILFFKYYISIICILIGILSIFIAGIYVGILRVNPFIDYMYKLRDFKVELHHKLLFKKENIYLKNFLEFQGDVNKDLFFSILTSKINSNKELMHVIVFFSGKNKIHEVEITEEEKFNIRENERKYPHGYNVLKDGSIIYNFDEGGSLNKISICGERQWSIPGRYHHLFSSNEKKGYLWAIKKEIFGDYEDAEKFVMISINDGKIIKEISVKDIMFANLPRDFFSIKQKKLEFVWDHDPFHFNDIDVLTNDKLKFFSNKYNEGDLLISARTLNSFFILDPNSLLIKDYFHAYTRRQHDPDWNNGYISVYDNQTKFKAFGKKPLRPHKTRIIKLNLNNEKIIIEKFIETGYGIDQRGNHDIFNFQNDEYTMVVLPTLNKIDLYKNTNKVGSILNKSELQIHNANFLDFDLNEKILQCSLKK